MDKAKREEKTQIGNQLKPKKKEKQKEKKKKKRPKCLAI